MRYSGSRTARERLSDLERVVDHQRSAIDMAQRVATERAFEPLRRDIVHHVLAQVATAVRDVSRASSSAEFANAVGRHLVRMLAPTQWAVFVRQGGDVAFVLVASGDASGAPVAEPGLEFGADCARLTHVARAGRVVDSAEFEEQERLARRPDGGALPHGLSIDVAVPVVVRDEVRAVFTVGGPDRELHEPHVVLELLADCAASALRFLDARRRRLEAERSDETTGLLNRQYFSAEASEICYRNRTRKVWSTVVMFGVDSHRAYVASNGHTAADRLMKSIAEMLTEAFDEHALVCRFATDEFMVSVTGLDLVAVTECAETVRCAVAAKGWNVSSDSGAARVTLSVGVAATEGGAASFDDLVQEVTGHLASARWGGGNQVVRGQDFTYSTNSSSTTRPYRSNDWSNACASTCLSGMPSKVGLLPIETAAPYRSPSTTSQAAYTPSAGMKPSGSGERLAVG
jgi:diguanylate cyclase (GGDEF)-like protein